jgi:hypothetical protein
VHRSDASGGEPLADRELGKDAGVFEGGGFHDSVRVAVVAVSIWRDDDAYVIAVWASTVCFGPVQLLFFRCPASSAAVPYRDVGGLTQRMHINDDAGAGKVAGCHPDC